MAAGEIWVSGGRAGVGPERSVKSLMLETGIIWCDGFGVDVVTARRLVRGHIVKRVPSRVGR